jgi:phage-related protein
MILACRSSSMPKFYTAAPGNGGSRKLRWPSCRTGVNSVRPELVSDMGRRTRRRPEQGGRIQSTYYRDARGVEPVYRFIKGLPFKQATKINQQIADHLNGRPADAPPPEFPITSQIDGELRELRIRFAGTRYRLLYQRSENLIVLLHAFEKNTGSLPRSETAIAGWRMANGGLQEANERQP